MSSSTSIEHTVDIASTPALVFDLWTTADGLAAWFGSAASVDRRIGGEIRVDVDGGNVMLGEFVELDRPRRLAFTFGWVDGEPPPGSTTVVVSIEPNGSGTRVRLRHSGLPTDLRDLHSSGWEHFLGELSNTKESSS